MSQDPTGLGPDSNPYRYVANGPTNATDPSGLQEPVEDVAAAAIVMKWAWRAAGGYSTVSTLVNLFSFNGQDFPMVEGVGQVVSLAATSFPGTGIYEVEQKVNDSANGRDGNLGMIDYGNGPIRNWNAVKFWFETSFGGGRLTTYDLGSGETDTATVSKKTLEDDKFNIKPALLPT